MLYILDYGGGNVASLANSVKSLGFDYKWVQSVEDIDKADKLLFPGVGNFDQAMASLRTKGYFEPLKAYIAAGRPYMGICIGMQALFLSSDESPHPGLGVIPHHVRKFSTTSSDPVKFPNNKSVPCIGWNGATLLRDGLDRDFGLKGEESFYFVHSFRADYEADGGMNDWSLTVTRYGDEVYTSSVLKDNVFATQFHPEKSGAAGLAVLKAWLDLSPEEASSSQGGAKLRTKEEVGQDLERKGFTKRIVACLDVRANDDGDLVVTKGDQYDVRESEEEEAITTSETVPAVAPTSTTISTSSVEAPATTTSTSSKKPRAVRNLGKPVDLAQRYFREGADEIAFLNITSFRTCPLHDQPMLDVVRRSAETVFVPLTIGGGIRDTVDPDGTKRSALEVAGTYFRCGADKVSIGGDAVEAVEEYLRTGVRDGTSSIQSISEGYGAQAVVVSIDPKRVYANSIEEVPESHRASVVDLAGPLPNRPDKPLKDDLGPNGERYCWYQCTVRGGREVRDLDVVQLAQGSEALGAGELLLNSVDRDGSKAGFDLRLVNLVRSSVGIPVVASSGAGKVEDFGEVFDQTDVEAALAAGIFHRKEVPIGDVKNYLRESGTKVRVDKA